LKRWTISRILYVSFFFMITLPIFLVTLYSARSFNTLLLKNTTSQALKTLEQVSYTFEGETRMMINTISSIGNDDRIIVSASEVNRAGKAGEVQRHFDQSKILDGQINSYFHYTFDLVSAVFFFKDQDTYSYKRALDIDEASFRQMDWYEEVLQHKNRVSLMGIQESGKSLHEKGYYVTGAISPKYSTLLYDVDMIYFVFHSSKLLSLLETKNSDAGAFYVLDDKGSVVASTDQKVLLRGVGDYLYLRQAKDRLHGSYIREINGLQSFIVYTTSETGWKFIQIVPYEEISRQVSDVYRTSLLIAAVGLVIFLFVSYLLVRSIIKPIVTLVKEMSALKSGNLSSSLQASGPLEIYLLGNRFNDMVGNMEQLIREIKEKEQQKKLADITALQSQINPHFLLNTLNTIKLMATISKVSNIEKMTEALTKLLSSTFNRGGMYLKVEDEMELLEYYFQIMRTRYGDMFDVHYEIDSRMKSAYILKLLLQPIIENSVIHGIHEKQTRGTILVKGELLNSQDCRFIIRDDGIGMQAEVLEGMLGRKAKSKNSFSGLGIRNVHERIILNYGLSYGVQLFSVPGEGTTIILNLPVIWSIPENSQ